MIIVTGTYPPERCGVGDYVQQLLCTAPAKEWSLLYLKQWRMKDLRGNVASLRQNKDRVVNLQYPTMGYGTSLVPHLMMIYAVLFLHKKLYITVHEYSQLGWKGKMALQFLFWFAKNVIFTTSFECELAHKHGLASRKGQVIKIRSNIPAAKSRPMKERQWHLGYFGYIRPLKGLEEFLPVAEQIRQAGKNVYVMGQTQPQYKDFYEPFLNRLKQKGITYISDRSAEEVAAVLADTRMMYLPYPDGLSERRGSFLAAVVNGTAIVSKEGAFTSDSQKECFALVKDDEAVGQIGAWLQDEQRLEQQQQNSLAYAAQSVPASWEQIANEYRHIMQ